MPDAASSSTTTPPDADPKQVSVVDATPVPTRDQIAASRAAIEASLADLNRNEAKLDLVQLQAMQTALADPSVDTVIKAFTAAKAELSTNPMRNQAAQNVIDCLTNTRVWLDNLVVEATTLASPPAANVVGPEGIPAPPPGVTILPNPAKP